MSNLDLFEKTKNEKELSKRIEARNEREKNDWEKLLALPWGRRLFYSLLEITGAFAQSYFGDTTETIYNEGKRNIGLWILDKANKAKPEAVLQSLREAYSEKKADSILEEKIKEEKEKENG